MSRIKGQVNIEFVAATLVYVVALGVALSAAEGVLPDVYDRGDRVSKNLELYRISSHVVSSTGASEDEGADWHLDEPRDVTSVGFTSGEHGNLSLEKINRLESFTVTGGSGLNYSVFKETMGVKNQYRFVFTWMPVVQTPTPVPNSRYVREGSGADSLRLYLRFDERPLKDFSGENVLLEEEGDPEIVDDGALGNRSMEFEKTENVSTDTTFSADTYTISGWIKPDDEARTGLAAGMESSLSVGISSSSDDDTGNLTLREEDSGTVRQVYSRSVRPNRWIHFAAVRNGSGTAAFYIDGVRVSEGEQVVKAEGRFSAGSDSFRGRLDELRFHDEALDSRRVQELYRGTDEHSKLAGKPIELPSSDLSGYELKYGNDTVGREVHVLLGDQGTSRAVWISPDLDFTSAERLSKGDVYVGSPPRPPLSSIDNGLRLSRIDTESDFIAFSGQIESFGPEPERERRVVKLNRYGKLHGEPIRVEAFAW